MLTSLATANFKSLRRVSLLLLFGIAVLVLGCAESTPVLPDSAKQPPARANSVEVGDRNSNSGESSSSTASKPTSEKQAPPVSKTKPEPASVEPNRVTPELERPVDPAAPKNEQTQTQTELSTPAKNQFDQPTAEQLVRWSRTEFETLQLLDFQERNQQGLLTCLAPLPDGKQVVLAGRKVALWSIIGEQPEHLFLDLSESPHEHFIRCMAVSPDAKWIAAGDSKGMLYIWSIVDRKELISKPIYSNDVSHLAISPDSKEIATLSFDNEITIWQSNTLEQIKQFKVDTNGIEAIEFLAPGLLVAAGETTSSWNTDTGKLNQQLSAGRYNFNLARSADDKNFVYGTKEGLQLWNVAEGKRTELLLGNFANNELVQFSPNGKFLITANGSSLRIWDIASGQVRQVIDTYGSAIVGLSWLQNSELVLVVTANGRSRLWGTSSSGAAFNLSPLHNSITVPDPAATIAASPAQMLAAIDLRYLPVFPGGIPSISTETMIDYVAPVTSQEAIQFNDYALGKLGWSHVPLDGTAAGGIEYRKSGLRMSVSTFDEGESKTRISCNLRSNVDLRRLPKFDGAPIELVYENEDTVIYHSKADLIQLETSLLRKMHDVGWTAYSRLKSSRDEQAEHRDLKFVQNGATVQISISRLPADPTSFNIQYSLFLTMNSIPIPKDAGFVEFDGSTEPCLVASTSMNLDQTCKFYDQEMVIQGWIPVQAGRVLNEKNNWLSYVQGQKDLMIGLTALDNGRTQIQVGEGVVDSSWQLAESKPDSQVVASTSGIEAAEFPVLNPSKSAKYNVDEKSIEVQLDAIGLLEAADRYVQAMESLGWKPDTGGIKADDYVMLTFTKENDEITLRGRITAGNAIINVQGPGLNWSKPLPGGKTIVSYETWLRRNRRPASLDLLDEYISEMRGIEASATR